MIAWRQPDRWGRGGPGSHGVKRLTGTGLVVGGAALGLALIGRRLGVGRLLRRFGRGASCPDASTQPRPASLPVVASRRARNVEAARLASSIGADVALTRARKVFARAQRRGELDDALSLRTAEQVVESLGGMKGALMKIGQMASYLDEGLPEPIRDALASLQSGAPPMSGELAAGCVERELGRPPEDLFIEWDPVPLAAASIGQVHRALCLDPADGLEKAVAVKVQYPGVDQAITADLANADLLGNVLRMLFRGLDPEPLVEEIRERVVEELDYLREADNQRLFADFYRDHPFIIVPRVVDAFSSRRVLTTELATGARFDELLTWPQEEKDLAAEAIYRFVFRSLYRFQAFNGDPHPGNYLFEKGGRVTFLDFGLVKRFTNSELAVFEQLIEAAVLHPDPARFRRIVEDVGLLRRNAPVSTEETNRYFEAFYAMVRDPRPSTITSAYASEMVRRVFDTDSPIAQHATLPRSFVVIQRINLGLYSILARLHATGAWRSIAEELWPMTSGPPSTPLGEAEAAWLAAP